MKGIIINSIGAANPSIATLIADTFEVNHELLIKQLYNAPFLFLEKAEDEIAEKTADLLVQLGLDVSIIEAHTELPKKSEPIDISVYVTNPLQLNKVTKQLSEFLGCKENEALSLLLNQPSVVLGNVSMATAEVLQKRIDAEVIASNPKTDLYLLEINGNDQQLMNDISSCLSAPHKFTINSKRSVLKDLTYQKAQELWSRYHLTKKIRLYNQSYQRALITLENFDADNAVQKSFLVNEIGMPEEALELIYKNLPVVIEESLNLNMAREKSDLFKSIGLECQQKKIPFGKYKIEVDNINDPIKFTEIINQVFKETKIENDTKKWSAPTPIDSILNRYLEKQLELIGCEITHQYESA